MVSQKIKSIQNAISDYNPTTKRAKGEIREFIGGYVAKDLVDQLRNEANAQHRTMTGQLTVILEQFFAK